jgi:hypothetical protein
MGQSFKEKLDSVLKLENFAAVAGKKNTYERTFDVQKKKAGLKVEKIRVRLRVTGQNIAYTVNWVDMVGSRTKRVRTGSVQLLPTDGHADIWCKVGDIAKIGKQFAVAYAQ